MDHAYHAELQAIRRQTYASLPSGLQIMAAVDEQQQADVTRFKPRPDPAHPPIAQSPAQAMIESYCAARASAVSGRSSGRGLAKSNMLRQLERDGTPAAPEPAPKLSPSMASMQRLLRNHTR
ncbi:hypothetical protein [Methylobacterium planeticum]|uniref:Uncharacterized protein n=1 Tax=Methylobacterium planeticum TaxID=2615211 RepID=A0A6N6MQ55_9HYPH|nr:hypothetical protein [Methylobacterium planeticum]KAB1071509.1 hypothetical protein F6X51_19540 [Methylobacterium planeticum]